MTLGEKILILRKQNGLSQEQLAEKISISRQAISRWELNESIPDVDNIVQLSKVFNVSTDYLLRSTVADMTHDEGGSTELVTTRDITHDTPRRDKMLGLQRFSLFFGLISPCIYLLLGFVFGWWHPGWIILVFPWLLLAAASAIEHV